MYCLLALIMNLAVHEAGFRRGGWRGLSIPKAHIAAWAHLLAGYRALTEKVVGQPWLRPLLALGYTYGFRKAELLNLQCGQVDLFSRTIRLNPGETKNGEGRTVKLTEECYQLLAQMMKGRQADEFLLIRENGKPVKDFRVAWEELAESAKMPGLLFHDLRRSAVRNMRRRGVSEKVAMRISGHKTRSTFDRYDIVDESDLADATLKVESGAKAELARASVIHSSCIVEGQEEENRKEGNARKPVQ